MQRLSLNKRQYPGWLGLSRLPEYLREPLLSGFVVQFCYWFYAMFCYSVWSSAVWRNII